MDETRRAGDFDYTSGMFLQKLSLLIVASVLLTACDYLPDALMPETTPTSPPAAMTEETPPAESVSPPEATPTATPAPAVQTLRIWLPPDMSPQSETAGGEVLQELLTAFERQRADLTLEIEVKPITGQGGILSYLRTGRAVAPSILPDVIILSSDHLPLATTENLIYPLDNLLNQAQLDDLYPAARQLSRVENSSMAMPFSLTNVQHLAYNSQVLTGTLPVTWNELIEEEGATFAFPAAGSEGAELALMLYLAAGGQLAVEGGQVSLEIEPLTRALEKLNRGRREGLVYVQSGNAATLSEAWQLFTAGSVTIVHTKANFYLNQDREGLDSAYAPIPGLDGALSPLVKAWTLAISASDPARQAVAMELIDWLTEAENLGQWSQASNLPPAGRSAFTAWPEDDEYARFIQAELERARPYPTAVSGTLLVALGNAVFDVVTLTMSPQAAAERAVNELLPP